MQWPIPDYSAPPDSLAGFRGGGLLLRERKGKGVRKGRPTSKGREGEEREGKGRKSKGVRFFLLSRSGNPKGVIAQNKVASLCGPAASNVQQLSNALMAIGFSCVVRDWRHLVPYV